MRKASKPARRRKKKRYLRVLMAFILILAFGAGLGYSYLSHMTVSEGAEGFPTPDDRVNVLVVGIARGMSDTIMLCSFDKTDGSLDIISVPRDTYYPREGYRHTAQKKINAAYGAGGVQATAKCVSDLLKMPIHYYFEIDYKGVEEIVDAMGGLKITVPRDMDYDDPADDLHIHFKKGQTISSGADIVRVLRWRKNNHKVGGGYAQGDIGRIEMQQSVVKAGIAKLTQGNVLLTFWKIKAPIIDNLKTNMTPKQMLYYAFQARKIDKEKISMQTIPGAPKMIHGLSFYQPDKDKIKTLVEGILADTLN